MLDELDWPQFVEWMAFEKIDPSSEERADVRTAIVAWTVAAAFSKKGRSPKLEDFMPRYDRGYRPPRRMTAKEIEFQLAMATASINAAKASRRRRLEKRPPDA